MNTQSPPPSNWFLKIAGVICLVLGVVLVFFTKGVRTLDALFLLIPFLGGGLLFVLAGYALLRRARR